MVINFHFCLLIDNRQIKGIEFDLEQRETFPNLKEFRRFFTIFVPITSTSNTDIIYLFLI